MSELVAKWMFFFGQLCIAIALVGPLFDNEMPYTTSLWMLPVGVTALVVTHLLLKRADRRKREREAEVR